MNDDNQLQQQVIVRFCDGSSSTEDYVEHPRIYIKIKIGEKAECPYCGQEICY